jgi:hypothetical protein
MTKYGVQLATVLAAIALCGGAYAACPTAPTQVGLTGKDASSATQTVSTITYQSNQAPTHLTLSVNPSGTPVPVNADANCNAIANAPLSLTTTNPTSTLTLPSTTTAYAAGQLIANSATAGSVVVPSFSIANSGGGAAIPRLRLSTNDTTSTAWGAVNIQIDLWSAAPTFTNGDRGAFLPATGTGAHLGAYTCTMSAEYGDGAYAECAPLVGNFSLPALASGTSIFWTMQAVSASGVTGASKVFTLTPEISN